MLHALIVEDHEDTRNWLGAILNEAFSEVETVEAATLEQARKNVAGNSFNLALVDISLPDGSGIDLLKELNHASPETYLVVTTIFDDDKHLFAALEAGAQGYLLKDQPRKRIIQQLTAMMRGEPPLSPGITRRILRYFNQLQGNSPSQEEETIQLTGRESDVLQLLAHGYNRNDIATTLGITANTAAGYIKTIYQKLNVSGRAEAAMKAVHLGLIEGES